MTTALHKAVIKKIREQPPAALGLRGRKISKEVAAIAADVVIDKLKRGPRLMPDNIMKEKTGLVSNPFASYGLDDFDSISYNDFERTDFINAIKQLKHLGYMWKLAASV